MSRDAKALAKRLQPGVEKGGVGAALQTHYYVFGNQSDVNGLTC